jgi:uncharacterized membrane protein YcfT
VTSVADDPGRPRTHPLAGRSAVVQDGAGGSPAKQRLAYLDNLKTLLVVGVIALHAAITFDGSWYLESYDEMSSAVVDVLTIVLGTG